MSSLVHNAAVGGMKPFCSCGVAYASVCLCVCITLRGSQFCCLVSRVTSIYPIGGAQDRLHWKDQPASYLHELDIWRPDEVLAASQ